MQRKSTIRSLVLILVSLVLLVIAWKAGPDAINQWSNSTTLGQKSETIIQFICSVLSIIVLLTAWFRIPFAKIIQYTWGLSLVSASVISALVWGPPMLLPVIVFGLIAGGISFGVIYFIRKYSNIKTSYGISTFRPRYPKSSSPASAKVLLVPDRLI